MKFFNSALLSLSLAAAFSINLSGCGGSSSNAGTPVPVVPVPPVTLPIEPPSVPASPPGGLYVGYYQEDPVTNPEDPTAGAFVLNLPAADAPLNGAMYFTYVGCQTMNVGNVSGTKSGNGLSGTWSGTLDGHVESGPYGGTYDPAAGIYQGVYSNAGGKQLIDVPGCIRYFIAPKGTWAIFPIENNLPANYVVAVTGTTASWLNPTGAASTLLYVIDPAIVSAGSGNPAKFQTILPSSFSSFNLAAIGLTSGKEYIVATLVSNSSSSRLAFGSKRFTAP